MDEVVISDWIFNFVDLTRQTAEMLIPPNVMDAAPVAGLVLLAAALFSGIYGAHYARGILSAILGGLGFAVGRIAAQTFEIAPLLGGLAGLLALASLGYYTHRLWVGVAVGLLAGSVGFFAVGHDTLLPAALDYASNQIPTDTSGVSYQLGSAEEQQTLLNPHILESVREFVVGLYHHLREILPQASRDAAVVLILCVIGGFTLGVALTRWALILACAAMGSVLLNMSLATFAEAYAPGGWTERLSLHPKAALAFIGTSFLLSLLVQFRMTQQSTPQTASDKPKS